MKSRYLITLFLLFSLPQITSCGETDPVKKSDADTSNDFSDIVSGLPWTFMHSAKDVTGEVKTSSEPTTGVVAAKRHDFISKEPVSKNAQGSVYLRADLTVLQFTDAHTADEYLQAIELKAHPDMGLTYAWDYLLVRNENFYQLHTGCNVSEQNFDKMAANLKRLVGSVEGESAGELLCRCGGGCRKQ